MSEHKVKRVRSPSYPSVDLETAVQKLQAMYKFTHRTPVLITVLLPHWGFESATSANGMKLVAALKSYGLIDDHGQKENRKISITENAFKMLNVVKDSPEHKKLVQEAALSPEMYRHMWEYYDELPHFEAIKSHLVVEKKFNASSVKGFLDDYVKTIEYAELSKSDTIEGGVEEDSSEEDRSIGSYSGTLSVMPTKQGQSSSPVTLTEGVKTASNMRQEVFTLDSGDVVIRWPSSMSQESYEDFTAWLDILKRKVGRTVQESKAENKEIDETNNGE